MELKDKGILLTGGSSGLGKAMTKMLVDEGAKVMITGRDPHKVADVAQKYGCVGMAADVSNDEDIDRTYEVFKEKIGNLDVLINNAGFGHPAELTDLNREDFQRVFETNVFGAAMMAKRAAEIFKAQKHGDIVNIASTASLKGYAKGSVYAASKFALRCMSQCWQAELRPYNVRVIQINPSYVPTAFGVEDRTEKSLEGNLLTPDHIAHSVVCALKMGQKGFIPELSVFATNPF